MSRIVYFVILFAKSGSRNSTHNTWNTHAWAIHYKGNWCCMVDRYSIFIILLILKSSRHTIGVEGPRYIVCRQQSNSIGNANYILNNTTSWAHKKCFVTIVIILYIQSINKKFLKLQHSTAFLTKNNMSNMLLAH